MDASHIRVGNDCYARKSGVRDAFATGELAEAGEVPFQSVSHAN